jgi:hypothetical protein
VNVVKRNNRPKMKIAGFVAIAAVAITKVCAKPTQLESDTLTEKALSNLKAWVTENGFPSPQTCSWKTVARRKEWYVTFHTYINSLLKRIQVATEKKREAFIYQSRAMSRHSPSQNACLNRRGSENAL